MNSFKNIPGYKGYYKVDTYGNVLSAIRKPITKAGRKSEKKEILLVWNFGKKKKYPSVALSVNRVSKRYPVHRLVYWSHVGRIPKGKEINHKDGNPNNPELSNLELVTRSENMLHAYKTGLCKPKLGTDAPIAKLNEIKVREIRKLADSGIKQDTIAKMFEIHQTNVHYILSGKTWSHVK